MHTRKLAHTFTLALLGLSLSSLSFFPEARFRTVACVPEGVDGGIAAGPPLGIGQDLIGQVNDQATRESARDWYLYLSQIELRSLNQRQSIRATYGLKTPLFATAQDYVVPSLLPVPTTPLYGASGMLFAPPAFSGFVAPVALASAGPRFF